MVGDKGAGEFGLIQLIARDYEEKECSNRGFRHLICNLLRYINVCAYIAYIRICSFAISMKYFRNACDEDTKLETKGVDGQESPLLSTLQEIEEWNRIEPIVSKESEQHEKGIWSSSMKNNLKNASVETMSGDGDGVGSSSDFSSDSSLYKLPAMKLPPAPKNLSRNNSGPMASSSSNATPAKIAAVKAIEDELSPMINNLLDSINAATKL